MGVDVKNLIAAISPDVYCDAKVRSAAKKLSSQGKYLDAAKIAKPVDSHYLDAYRLQGTTGAFAYAGLKAPMEQHILVYDAFSQTLEPVYFWLLEYINGAYGGADKLVDTFAASAGSGHFAEMQGRATRMQEEAMKILQTTGMITKSIIQIIYDLKEFRIRLAHYDDYNGSEGSAKGAALLSLKQIWMDNVDMKRGGSAIKMLAQNFDYVTLIDAFMALDSVKSVDKLDLNDRVKRILQQRYSEFERWVVESERELRKRFDIERLHLRNQVNTVKLYSKWVRPYFKAARELEQKTEHNTDIINAFNTSVLELVILAKGRYNYNSDIAKGELPKALKGMKVRGCRSVTLLEFRFRSVPDRSDQKGGYNFRGRVEVKFTSYALNEDEMKVLKEQVQEDSFGDVFRLVQGATDESLDLLKDDIEQFLEEGALGKSPESKGASSDDDVNPFSALFSFASRKGKKEDFSKGVPKDSSMEKAIRNQASLASRIECRKLYDTYKKAHGMPAFPQTMKF